MLQKVTLVLTSTIITKVIKMKRFFDPNDIRLEVYSNTEEEALEWLNQKRIMLVAKNPQADVVFKEPVLYGNFETGYRGVQYYHMTLIRC